jgi:chromosome segregation ATPase
LANQAALQDAQRLHDEAAALLEEIEAEIAAMEAALATAQEGVAEAERTAADNSDHVAWLASELEVGHALARQAHEQLAAASSLRGRLAEQIRAEFQRQAIPGGGDESGAACRWRTPPAMPDFQGLARLQREARALPTSERTRIPWLEVAEDFPTLTEQVDDIHRLLDEAEEIGEAASRRIAERRRRKRDQALRPKQEARKDSR